MNDIHVMQKANGETNSPTEAEFDPIRWAQLDPCLSEDQADDRTPMNGSVKRHWRNTIRSASLRPEVSSGDVQKWFPSEARLTHSGAHEETDDSHPRAIWKISKECSVTGH